MRWVLLIVILSLCNSCWMVRHKNFTLPLNGHVKNNSIKMNGYFIHLNPADQFELLLFYNNGVAYKVNMGMGYLKDEGIDSFVAKRILTNQPIISDTKNPGSFQINGNKIEMNIIIHTNYNWHRVNVLQGTILTDTSIVIYSDDRPSIHHNQNDTVLYHFVPAAAKPDSTNWLRHRKWYRGK